VPFSLQAEAPMVHKFYMSYTYVDHNNIAGTLEIRSKIFTDDMERMILLSFGKIVHLENQSQMDNDLVKEYLNRVFNVSVNGQASNKSVLGYSYENDMIIVFIEAPCVNPKTVTFENKLFFDLFLDQKNMIELNWMGTSVREYLVKEKPQVTFFAS
jgi:hypothetical protein